MARVNGQGASAATLAMPVEGLEAPALNSDRDRHQRECGPRCRRARRPLQRPQGPDEADEYKGHEAWQTLHGG